MGPAALGRAGSGRGAALLGTSPPGRPCPSRHRLHAVRTKRSLSDSDHNSLGNAWEWACNPHQGICDRTKSCYRLDKPGRWCIPRRQRPGLSMPSGATRQRFSRPVAAGTINIVSRAGFSGRSHRSVVVGRRPEVLRTVPGVSSMGAVARTRGPHRQCEHGGERHHTRDGDLAQPGRAHPFLVVRRLLRLHQDSPGFDGYGPPNITAGGPADPATPPPPTVNRPHG